MILLNGILKRHKLLVGSAVVTDTYNGSVNKFHNTVTLGSNLRTGVAYKLSFQACTNYRGFRTKQRHSLAHHVRTHQGTVRVVMFKERNQRCGNRRNLCRRNIHKVNLLRFHNREVGIKTRLNAVTNKRPVIVKRGITLCNNLTLLYFGRQINNFVVIYINLRILHLAVRSLYKAQVVYLRIHAQRRNQTDIRAFRRFNRAETAVMRIVNVAHLETGTLTRQTAGTQRRHTALVSHFGQRVSLVHKLRQRVCTEERIDYRRYGLGVNQVNWSEILVITHVHTLADSTRHTGQTNTELVVKLLANRTHATVRQVVNIVNVGFRVNQFYKVLYNRNYILLCQDAHIHRCFEA